MLVVGIVAEGSDSGWRALETLGVNYREAHEALQAMVGKKDSTV